jgi:hypothetical protein
MNNKDGNAGERFSYDNHGNIVSYESVDAAGNPIELDKEKIYRIVSKYNDRSHLVEKRAWHANGDPYALLGRCEILRYKTDERGNPVEGYCFRHDGQLSKSDFAIFTNTFDDDDRAVEHTNFDRDGHPVLGPEGAFQEKDTYDLAGNITEYALYGEDGRPIADSKGFHKGIRTLKGGREIRTESRDADGTLVALDKGFAAVEKEYDAQGNETGRTYLGVDDRPVANRTEGYAIRTVSFDACGREIESKFFDADKHPMRSKKGYASIRQAYDESNNVKEEAYFDEENQPGRSVDGYARVTREFDRNRNIIDERYFDGQGIPFLVK